MWKSVCVCVCVPSQTEVERCVSVERMYFIIYRFRRRRRRRTHHYIGFLCWILCVGLGSVESAIFTAQTAKCLFRHSLSYSHIKFVTMASLSPFIYFIFIRSSSHMNLRYAVKWHPYESSMHTPLNQIILVSDNTSVCNFFVHTHYAVVGLHYEFLGILDQSTTWPISIAAYL